ncbi:MAG: XRE family transcriptional regulator [Clostridiales bacterium]|nr:XRE family transcriptional regulator [Clostridiales bacterium]
MNIGKKIRSLRQKNGLTQQELADRCELSKGFISLLESDQTSPSLSTLEDILTALGSSFSEFFREENEENPICRREDVFEKESDGKMIRWLIPDAQKKALEPILVRLSAGARTETVLPHEGEEFGYVLSGTATLVLGEKQYRVRRGDSFSFKPQSPHYLINAGKLPCETLWVVTPPNF